MNSKEKNILIGVNLPYKKKLLNSFTKRRRNFFNHYFKKNRFKIIKILDKNKKYYSSRISRFYVGLNDKSNVPKYISKLKKIWEDRDIIIVEGEKSRLGIGNDLFNNSKSIKRIICPCKNAFKVYDKILKKVLKIKKTNLIIIALGPTATILAYDLSLHGYQAIDIGHADIEYELYLRNATKMIPIKNKYVNEAKGQKQFFGKVDDINYYKQIIYKILY